MECGIWIITIELSVPIGSIPSVWTYGCSDISQVVQYADCQMSSVSPISNSPFVLPDRPETPWLNHRMVICPSQLHFPYSSRKVADTQQHNIGYVYKYRGLPFENTISLVGFGNVNLTPDNKQIISFILLGWYLYTIRIYFIYVVVYKHKYKYISYYNCLFLISLTTITIL